jgi:excisionase family DNA binding protein
MPDLATQTYLTVSEAQEYLRLPSKWAVYHWAASTPGLRKYRVGRTIRFKRIEIDRCLAGEVAPGLAIVRK